MTLVIASRSASPPLMRLSACLVSAAAWLGVLRFSGFYADSAPHMFVSMVAGVSAFPALAAALAIPKARIVTEGHLALVVVILAAVIGAAIIIASGSRLFLNLTSLSAILLIAFVSFRARNTISGVSALVMLAGSLCFATKFSPAPMLQPADILHLALAAGWLGIAARYRQINRRCIVG
ncbi:MAG: hypothetical protein FJ178_05845 [Gammaproteobacteria bacterium]|nr:hypothetical protein [Gammaproteobacteria bacterium]